MGKMAAPKIVVAAAALITAAGCASVSTPRYALLSEEKGYEIREYGGYIVAETTVPGPYRDAMYAGFRILFDYISGNNEAAQKVEMTAPVLEERPVAIAMTAPVLQEQEADSERHTVAFIAPEGYTLDTIPVPKDPRVRIREVPAHKVAALRFGGWADAEKVRRRSSELKKMLERDGRTVLSPFRSAQYNPPWTPPPFRRNEILVEIE
jgi:effector-binding domain-containing protein